MKQSVDIETTVFLKDSNQPFIHRSGRVFQSEDFLEFSLPGVYFEGSFFGTTLELHFEGKPNTSYCSGIPFEFEIDGVKNTIELSGKHQNFPLIQNLSEKEHHFRLTRKVESFCGPTRFKSFQTDGHFLEQKIQRPLVEMIGDSIVSGYGIEAHTAYENYKSTTQNILKTAGYLSAQKLGMDFRAISHSGKGLLQNFDGETKDILPELFRRNQPHLRAPWNPEEDPAADFVFIQAGTNDFANSPPEQEAFIAAVLDFSATLRRTYPEAKIIWLLGPMLNDDWPMNPITGQSVPSLSLCRKFMKEAFEELGPQFYLLELTGQNPSRGFGANWHPNILQQQLNATEIIDFLKGFLEV